VGGEVGDTEGVAEGAIVIAVGELEGDKLGVKVG
jgi:hypothetical protein